MPYLVAIGVPAPLAWVDRSLHQACPDVQIHPLPDAQWFRSFPATDSVVVIVSRGCACASCLALASGGVTLVSRRHTPTYALRQMVRRAAGEYGCVRLLVHRGDAGFLRWQLAPVRRQTTTLAGFLRSGRVVQEDTLLSIVLSR